MLTNLSVSCFSLLLLILIQQRASKWSHKFSIKRAVFTQGLTVFTQQCLEFTKIQQVTLSYSLKADNYYSENTYDFFRFYRFKFTVPIPYMSNSYSHFSQKSTLEDHILNIYKENSFFLLTFHLIVNFLVIKLPIK